MKHGDRKQEKETERQLVRLKDRKCLDKERGKEKTKEKDKTAQSKQKKDIDNKKEVEERRHEQI